MFDTKQRTILARSLDDVIAEQAAIGRQLRVESTPSGRYQVPRLPKWSAALQGQYGLLLDFDCQQLLWTVGGSALQLKSMFYHHLDIQCRGAMAKLVDDYKVRQVFTACGIPCATPAQCADALAQVIGCSGPCAGTALADALFKFSTGTGNITTWQLKFELGALPKPWSCLQDLNTSPLFLHPAVQALRVCHPDARQHLWTTGTTDGSVVAGVKSPIAALGLSPSGQPLLLGGTPADDAWWRLRKALAIALLRGCAWVKQLKVGVHHDVVGPFEDLELSTALSGPGGPFGCKSPWALDELAAGDAAIAAELTLLCAP